MKLKALISQDGISESTVAVTQHAGQSHRGRYRTTALWVVLLLFLTLAVAPQSEAAYQGPNVFNVDRNFAPSANIKYLYFQVPSGTTEIEVKGQIKSINTYNIDKKLTMGSDEYFFNIMGHYCRVYIDAKSDPDNWEAVLAFYNPYYAGELDVKLYAYGDGRDTHEIAQYYLDYYLWAGDDISFAYYYYYNGCAEYQDKNFSGNYYNALYYYYVGSAYCCYYYYRASYPAAANYYFLYQVANAYYYYSIDRYGLNTANYYYSLYMYYAGLYY